MNILKRPIITEKSLKKTKEGVYVFEVAKKANKNQIAKTIEETFGVSVKNISTIKMKGKVKRVGKLRKEKRASDWKKAVVTLVAGGKINIFPTT